MEADKRFSKLATGLLGMVNSNTLQRRLDVSNHRTIQNSRSRRRFLATRPSSFLSSAVASVCDPTSRLLKAPRLMLLSSLHLCRLAPPWGSHPPAYRRLRHRFGRRRLCRPRVHPIYRAPCEYAGGRRWLGCRTGLRSGKV